jgi:L-amino acid N-acyltransferase YncA
MTSWTECIGLALAEDIAGILELQEANLVSTGSGLSARFSRDWLITAIGQMPVVVARKEGRVIGYLVSSPVAAQSDLLIVQEMLRAYPVPNSVYLYGPICVAQSQRRRGLAERLFTTLTAQLPGRPAITFIRRDNIASIGAHMKMGMRQVAKFSHAGEPHVVMFWQGEHAEGGITGRLDL